MPDMPKMFRPAHLPTRIEQRRERDRKRDEEEWRGWYKTARWQKLKMRVHIRDLFTCRKTGVLLTGKFPAPNSPVADHIVKHEGDPVLFWDEENVQTVSKAYHDSEKQRIEHGLAPVWSIPKGIGRSGVMVHLVCGAPGSGKSTFVHGEAGPDDLVIDLDDIRQRLGLARYDSRPDALKRALAERDRLIATLEHRRKGVAWLIAMAPTDAERAAWVKALGKVTVHDMLTDAHECKDRIINDPTREGAIDHLLQQVDAYFARRHGSRAGGGVGQKSGPLAG
ncbi:ATP-binding protein [Mesorhizobium sp. YC-39]|uniref:ATP-binding protein n=1 Tax=unclassified Mesorhizobium TaxID=325217 RepID=UPI0021E8AD2B|nr:MULTISPECIES: ATP-binding protein [unclassified Mesorhizobium]MCV3209616.1 ATP-binding protein [Mesorhizobium sp. YC-2]MCV3230146.1 ATP-binding protein [Mesorhizobium sp. YC-39]